ncbi:hypothetical protein Q5752_004291 [Cryptotrichosporon argae]
MTAQASEIPGRPKRPLVVKCGYDNASRRINFPSAASCRLESLRQRVEECFALSMFAFHLSYMDDDGDENPVHTEADLTEAIAYFVSGDDDAVVPAYAGQAGQAGPSHALALPPTKITMRLDVAVEYDGPSLSETSSLSSFRTSGTGRSRHSSRLGTSRTASTYTASRASEYGMRTDAVLEEDEVADAMRRTGLADDADNLLSTTDGSQQTPRRSSKMRAASAHGSARGLDTARAGAARLTGPESEPAPSLLTHSELGSRWLREQSQLARRMPGARARPYDSDDESDDEATGDIALVRDARGKYYYSYQSTETSSLFSDDDSYVGAGPSGRSYASHSHASLASARSSPPAPAPLELVRVAEPAGPPLLAPDCSACGVRLDYMRYVCQTCGEGVMWTEGAEGKEAFRPPLRDAEGEVEGDSESSGSTVWRDAGGSGASGSQTAYTSPRSRAGSVETEATSSSLQVADGSAAPTTPPDSPSSPLSTQGLLELGIAANNGKARRSLPRGYELCAGCIEVRGIAHSKAAAREARALAREDGRRRRAGEMRHTFREMIWGAEGWIDVEYAEDAECTICRSPLFQNRFKCVSCPKFDLCRSCYQKVDEIHPVHAFLSIPDREFAIDDPAVGRVDRGERQPARHPGAFCHNCLQDIVGPRFHCAVCPSWDLCIQCEGVSAPGGGSHTADHIMMKIPNPLPNAEVEAVSRRARDRWFAQDRTVAASLPPIPPASSRSSSPTEGTVYGAPQAHAPARTELPALGLQTRRTDARDPFASPTSTGARTPFGSGASVASSHGTGHNSGRATPQARGWVDELDHNARCNNCNEWIMGRRFQCANCPSLPVPYNLCSICELRSYRIHDPRHVFFKFDRPVHIPLQSAGPLLPLLYKSRVGEIPTGVAINPRDPTAYLRHVLHRETLCDIHSDQIRGTWLRCAHCAAGFDICQEAEQIADHDATHVFVVFKARVDMAAFRALADLAATHSKPLLRQQVYLS